MGGGNRFNTQEVSLGERRVLKMQVLTASPVMAFWPAFLRLWRRLFVGLDDFDVMVVEKITGGVIELRHGQLVIDLCLNETLLCLG